jgi:hypothetical protein
MGGAHTYGSRGLPALVYVIGARLTKPLFPVLACYTFWHYRIVVGVSIFSNLPVVLPIFTSSGVLASWTR